MSSSYDPRRSRPRLAASPPADTAPVEALLGPGPGQRDEPASANGSHRPTPVVRHDHAGAPSKLLQLAPVLAIASFLAAVLWWLTRHRD